MSDKVVNIYEVSPNCGHDFDGRCWQVVAPSRGKAHALFVHFINDWPFDYLDFTDKVNIRLLEKSVDLPEGVIEAQTT